MATRTKTGYRKYIDSEEWQERRREFLIYHDKCERCAIPRWLAEVAYDQDLNVHHKSYGNLGAEDWDALEALCRRCHEIHKFGRSELRAPKSAKCSLCECTHWNPYEDTCGPCHEIASRCLTCCICKQRVFPALDVGALPDICQSCHDFKIGNMDSVWWSSGNPLMANPEWNLSDAILCAIYAKLGTNRILDSLIKLKPHAIQYKHQQEEREKKRNTPISDDDIPF